MKDLISLSLKRYRYTLSVIYSIFKFALKLFAHHLIHMLGVYLNALQSENVWYTYDKSRTVFHFSIQTRRFLRVYHSPNFPSIRYHLDKQYNHTRDIFLL